MQAAAEPPKLLIENIQKTFFRETDDKIVGIRVLGDNGWYDTRTRKGGLTLRDLTKR